DARGGRLFAGSQDGFDDLVITGAPAQHAADAVEHLLLGWLRAPAQRIRGRHQHARRTDSALRRPMVEERALKSREEWVDARGGFDRGDAARACLSGRYEARTDLLAIEQHRASTTIAGGTANLGARQP